MRALYRLVLSSQDAILQLFSDHKLCFPRENGKRGELFFSAGLAWASAVRGRAFCPMPRDTLKHTWRVMGKSSLFGMVSPIVCLRDRMLVGPRIEMSTWKN